MSSAFCFILDQSKILLSGNGLGKNENVGKNARGKNARCKNFRFKIAIGKNVRAKVVNIP